MSAKVRKIDFSPDEWIAGTVGLTLAEEGLYIRICALIYSHGGPITYELIKKASHNDHGNRIKACLDRLVALHKVTRNGSEIDQKRCRFELENARIRIGNALENGSKGGRPKGLAKPAGYFRENLSLTTTCKKEGFSPKELNPVFLTARDATPPPLPSRGDGDGAALRATTTKAEPEAPTAFDDPELRAEAIATFDRCLAAVRGKLPVLDAEATVPPPDPRLVQFRARLQRLNTVASERLGGNTRLQAWDVIGRASELGDPLALPPAMLDDLAAIESLEPCAEAAE